MFTPRGPVAGSFQHTLLPLERAPEVAILVSRAFAFVFSWYKVIIALSLYFSSWVLQHTVHISIIAAKIVSLEFFFRAPIFRSGLEARSNKNSNTNPVIKKCRLLTADRVQNADWEFILFFRLIRDNMSSFNLPSVTQSLFRDHPVHEYLHYWGIFLARFSITIVVNII